MGYIHAKTNYSELVKATNGVLHEIVLDWLGIDQTGNLVIDEKKFNADFIAEMHSQGVKVTAMLSSGFSREIGIAALNNAEVLTDQIVALVEARNLDGINYDIENLSHNERDMQTAFVQLLRAKLPADKILGVAVTANPRKWKEGWHASYDMPALADASDYLMLMAYDDGYAGGPERPVASIGYVESCILDLLERGVDSQKIVLGIPLYGRIWSTDGSLLGLGVELTSAYRMVEDTSLIEKSYTYDDEAQAALLSFTALAPYPVYTWRDIPAGSYNLWFENEASLKAKVALGQKYNLLGLGHWSIGQADGSLVTSIANWSKNANDVIIDDPIKEEIPVKSPTPESEIPQASTPPVNVIDETLIYEPRFQDIEGHWAEADILYADKQGWFGWLIGTEYEPEQVLKRAEVATSLMSFFKLAEVKLGEISFSDVPADYWAWMSIEAVVAQGMMGGTNTEAKTFAPEAVFSRAHLASIFDRLFTEAENTARQSIDWLSLTNPYTDLSDDHWAKVPLLRMVERGLLVGYISEDGSMIMQADRTISRAELAVLLGRLENWFQMEPEWHVVLK